MLEELKVGDEVKGSENIDPSDRRFKGARGTIVSIRGPRIWVNFQKDIIPSRAMYRRELVKIPNERG